MYLQTEEAEVPRRRRHHNAFQMVLMGIVIFLMFFVTLGFQFLATFGGKAFLMAKLALLLASINGLKRVSWIHWLWEYFHWFILHDFKGRIQRSSLWVRMTSYEVDLITDARIFSYIRLYHQSDPTLYAYDRFDRPRTLL